MRILQNHFSQHKILGRRLTQQCHFVHFDKVLRTDTVSGQCFNLVGGGKDASLIGGESGETLGIREVLRVLKFIERIHFIPPVAMIVFTPIAVIHSVFHAVNDPGMCTPASITAEINRPPVIQLMSNQTPPSRNSVAVAVAKLYGLVTELLLQHIDHTLRAGRGGVDTIFRSQGLPHPHGEVGNSLGRFVAVGTVEIVLLHVDPVYRGSLRHCWQRELVCSIFCNLRCQSIGEMPVIDHVLDSRSHTPHQSSLPVNQRTGIVERSALRASGMH